MKNIKKMSFGLVSSVLLLSILTPLFTTQAIKNDNDTYELKVNDSFIEVFVYNETMDAIQGATVDLYDFMWMPVDAGLTDVTGLYNFTGLSVGDFFIEVNMLGYEPKEDNATLDFDGEGEHLQINLPVIYQSGINFIEVTVYDIDTLVAVPGADVVLMNENYYTIDYQTADINGYYNFTHLGPATYIVEAYPTGYFSNITTVEIAFDGDSKQINIYVTEEYLHGSGYIEVFVYDFDTLLPIVDASVTLYEEHHIDIDYGMTDSSGFYNFSGYGIGNYIVEASVWPYVTQSNATYISFDGEGVHVEVYPYKPPRIVDILTPVDSQVVEGGSVLVGFTASDWIDLQTIDVYVNAILLYTAIIYGGSTNECIVPVFLNGTNTIYLEGHWSDASTGSDSVDINSIDVIPIVNVREGDILNYRQLDLAGSVTWDFNYTFTNWIMPFEMNTSMYIHQYDSGGTIMQGQFWLTVNVLNGYVSSDTAGMFLNGHFFPFNSLSPSTVVGDKISWVPWDQLMTVNGSKIWEYTEVWTLDLSAGFMTMYVEKSSNLVYYLTMPGFVEVTLLLTTIDFLNPYVFDLSDFSYNEGETGNTISWGATDMNPWMYTIYNNTVLLETGYWTSDTNITINIDGLAPGTYDYRIVITDARGNLVEDTLTVTVNVVFAEINPMLYLIFAPMSIFIVYAIKRKRQN